MTGPLMTAREVAPLIDRHEKTVLTLAREKRLRCIKQGTRTIRFTQEHVDEYLASCEVGVEPVEVKPARNPKYSR